MSISAAIQPEPESTNVIPFVPFTKTPNDLLARLQKMPLSGAEFRVILHIVRQTYGFHRESISFDLNAICEATELSKSGVYDTIKKLKAKNIIEQSTNELSFVHDHGLTPVYKERKEKQLREVVVVSSEISESVLGPSAHQKPVEIQIVEKAITEPNDKTVDSIETKEVHADPVFSIPKINELLAISKHPESNQTRGVILRAVKAGMSQNEIRAALEYVNQRNGVKNYPAYLAKTINERYFEDWKKDQGQQRTEAIMNPQVEMKRPTDEEREELLSEIRRYRKEKRQKYQATADINERKALLLKQAEQIKNTKEL